MRYVGEWAETLRAVGGVIRCVGGRIHDVSEYEKAVVRPALSNRAADARIAVCEAVR
jgi:hypothetical protein